MRNPGTAGTGRLADIEKLEREIRQAQQAIDETTGTAESAANLIQATVTGRGRLTKLVLDERVYDELAPEALAEEIVRAVDAARERAEQSALDTWAAALPTAPVPDGNDPEFGPLLAEMRRMRAAGDAGQRR
ncbi:DNA-binding protein YbaB [Kribbella antiqua]|uniref:DNA-binding protein YbaB n=1 Tax=Kribbella antiqua TaxID=2512217 RepID=A0A4R2IGZ7_9ACTN|nr:YbaB/EbfC family nucleoid-associated protein [Kribbella antiqua]TCO43707.1 DNA-binding protein YbaB [Kribbella antiqua]